jgi:hypothetical protein
VSGEQVPHLQLATESPLGDWPTRGQDRSSEAFLALRESLGDESSRTDRRGLFGMIGRGALVITASGLPPSRRARRACDRLTWSVLRLVAPASFL